MSNGDLNWITNFIWGIADDVLRDLYVRGKYRDVVLPMTVLRRLDAVLEPTKQAVLDMKTRLDKAGITNQDQALRQAAGQSFYNTSKFTLRDLRARASQQQLKADFEAYLDGYSPNVQEIFDNFEFRNQIPRLSKADVLGTLIEKLLDPSINLSPNPVVNNDGSVKHPGLDNHAMGSIFEELVRKFNEENNEEAGEHWTPRDAVRLMARLIFLPIADQIESGTYLLYDGAYGTGGMLTVGEETLQQLAKSTARKSPRTFTVKRSMPKPMRSAKPTCCSKARADPKQKNRVCLSPFVGVGPRRYRDLFSTTTSDGTRIERADNRGQAIKPAEREIRLKIGTLSTSQFDNEAGFIENLRDTLRAVRFQKEDTNE